MCGQIIGINHGVDGIITEQSNLLQFLFCTIKDEVLRLRQVNNGCMWNLVFKFLFFIVAYDSNQEVYFKVRDFIGIVRNITDIGTMLVIEGPDL